MKDKIYPEMVFGKPTRSTVIGDGLKIPSISFTAILTTLSAKTPSSHMSASQRNKLKASFYEANQFQALVQGKSLAFISRIDMVSEETAKKIHDWARSRPKVCEAPISSAPAEGVALIRGFKIKHGCSGRVMRIATDLEISISAFTSIVSHYNLGESSENKTSYQRSKMRERCNISTSEDFLHLVSHATEAKMKSLYQVSPATSKAVRAWVKKHDFITRGDPELKRQEEKRKKSHTDMYVTEHIGIRDSLIQTMLGGMAANPALAHRFIDSSEHEALVTHVSSIADKVIHDRMNYYTITKKN